MKLCQQRPLEKELENTKGTVREKGTSINDGHEGDSFERQSKHRRKGVCNNLRDGLHVSGVFQEIIETHLANGRHSTGDDEITGVHG